jgi:hypothetical protein
VFQPVSQVSYHVIDGDKQILVCSLEGDHRRSGLLERWKTRALATFSFTEADDLCDVVRDLLANPQVRAIVFDGSSPVEATFRAFWTRQIAPAWKINEEHLELVRQFVDLFNEDCGFHKPQQPFWPQRLKYQEE